MRPLGARRRRARKNWRAGSSRSPTTAPRGFRPLYEDATPLWDKVRTIATQIYGAADIAADRGDPPAIPTTAGGRLRRAAGLHRQDALFLLCRSEPARRAERPYRADPRIAPARRRRLRRRSARRRPDDAGPCRASPPPSRSGSATGGSSGFFERGVQSLWDSGPAAVSSASRVGRLAWRGKPRIVAARGSLPPAARREVDDCSLMKSAR